MSSESRQFDETLMVIGQPESRRVKLFLEEAFRQGWRDCRVVSYPQLLSADSPEQLMPRGSLVRIDSPAECTDTMRLLLQRGMEPLEAAGKRPLSLREIASLAPGRGEMIHPLQWYLGFRQLLLALQECGAAAGCRWMNSPSSLTACFDKLETRRRWESRDLPMPVSWQGIRLYDQLRKSIGRPHARLFIKLRYGYSALGAVALEWRADRVRAITAMETSWSCGRPRLFLTKRPRVLTRETEIAWLVDTLAMEEIVVEEWLPKARIAGTPFDVRAVVVDRQAGHLVGRAGNSPFTNLNLDAQRVGRDSIEARLGAHWNELMMLAESAAAAFPDALYLGIDVLVGSNRKRFYLLEANAMGDYLPRLTHAGESIYATELRALKQREEAPV